MAEYLIILTWPAIVAGVTRLSGKTKAVKILNKIEYRYYILPFIIAVIPLIYFTINRTLYFGDTSIYVQSFNKMPTDFSEIKNYYYASSSD